MTLQFLISLFLILFTLDQPCRATNSTGHEVVLPQLELQPSGSAQARDQVRQVIQNQIERQLQQEIFKTQKTDFIRNSIEYAETQHAYIYRINIPSALQETLHVMIKNHAIVLYDNQMTSFQRVIPLPDDATTANIQPVQKNGVMIIHVNKVVIQS